uniref:6-hydroxymethylpterin diphosphokinase MptE-like domain-containing protein n=1 Tax=viral metagenome TaxID=1070528 RepID=A0A6H1ZPH3_9ZZZZ
MGERIIETNEPNKEWRTYLTNEHGESVHSVLTDIFHILKNEGCLGTFEKIKDFLQLDEYIERGLTGHEIIEEWWRQAMHGPDWYREDGAVGVSIGEIMLGDDRETPHIMAVWHFPDMDKDGDYTGKQSVLFASDVTSPFYEEIKDSGSMPAKNITAAFKLNYSTNKRKSDGFLLGVKELQGSHRGKPCIVVGNGPSLERQIPLLKKVFADRGDLCVLGTNRAVEYFGPDALDYYMQLDYSSNEGWWSNVPRSKAEKVKAILWTVVGPWVHRIFSPKHMYWMHDQFHFPWLPMDEQRDLAKRIGVVGAGPNIAHWSLSFAYRILEADPIILVGVDHAYTWGNCHVGEPVSRAMVENPTFHSGLEFCYDCKDRLTATDGRMKRHNRALNGLCSFIRNGGWPHESQRSARVVNCSEWGLPLEWAEQCDLEEFLKGEVFDEDDFQRRFTDGLESPSGGVPAPVQGTDQARRSIRIA